MISPNQFPFYLVTDHGWQYDFVEDLAAWRLKREWRNAVYYLYVPIHTGFIPDDQRQIKLFVHERGEDGYLNEFPCLEIKRNWTDAKKMESLQEYLRQAFK